MVYILKRLDNKNSQRLRLKKRAEIVRRHEMGVLPKCYYSLNKKGRPYLSPHKLIKEGA